MAFAEDNSDFWRGLLACATKGSPYTSPEAAQLARYQQLVSQQPNLYQQDPAWRRNSLAEAFQRNKPTPVVEEPKKPEPVKEPRSRWDQVVAEAFTDNKGGDDGKAQEDADAERDWGDAGE